MLKACKAIGAAVLSAVIYMADVSNTFDIWMKRQVSLAPTV